MPEPITILHIEDNPENRILVRRLLQLEGYTVLEAENAYQALSILESHLPELILVDINMPGMDGYTLTSKIRNLPEFNSVPVIAITANVMKGDREKTLQAGCDGYIEKPIDVDRFGEQIEQFLSPSLTFAIQVTADEVKAQ
jgi:two-component system, cell cycle response regulator DivK